MKYIRKIKIFLSVIVLLAFLASCAKDYQGDIDKLNTTHISIEQRAEALELQVSTVNTQLKTLSVLSEAVEQGFYLTAVKSTNDGYELTLNNGRVIKLNTTPNGTLSPMPALSMTQINGFFYWTLNGMLFTDIEGKPIRSTGQTPILKYDYSINQWVISIDGGTTFKDINAYASIFINEQVLMQVINSFANQHSTTLFSKQLLYQIVSTYIQQSYKELFNTEILDKVVTNYVNERYTRIFSYELLDKIFSQYNHEYVTSNIKVDELVSVIVDFIQQHNEIFEDNEVLYEIVSSFLKANKTTIFTEDILREAVDKFIEENQNYIDINVLTEVVTNYIDIHRNDVFNTETVRRLLLEYVEKYYMKAFTEDILIQVFNTCITQNMTTIFNDTLLTEIISQYVNNNFYSVINEEIIENIVRDYVRENSTTVFHRELIVEVINNYLETYGIDVNQKDVENIIDNYILENKTQIIDIDVVTSLIKSYVTTHYRELFNIDQLSEIVINYLNENREVIAKSINLGNDIIKSVDMGNDFCTITLSDGNVIKLVIYDTLARLSDRVQSIVAMTADGHFSDSQNFYANYLVSPASMATIIQTKYYSKEITMLLKGVDENGKVSNIAVNPPTASNDGVLQVSANLDKTVKAVALYVKENKLGGTDIMTEFTVIGDGGTPCRGDIPENPDPNDTPSLYNDNVKVPYPSVSTSIDECDNYVVKMNLTGIQNPNTNEWIDLYGTGKNNQNVWVEVDGKAKGITVENENKTERVKNDIIFTIDASGSMGGEADAIANGIKQWANMLSNKGLDVKFGIVGYAYEYERGITGGIDMTSSSEISSYLNRYTGTMRTYKFGGSNASKLENIVKNNDLWYKNYYENGVQAVRFANENFTFRTSSNRIYINFTDDCNKTSGDNRVSVNYFKDKTNWPVSNGTIHSVISKDTSTIVSCKMANHELPWLMSRYTNGTIKTVKSDASDLNLDQLTVSDAIIHSYTIRFIIPKNMLDGKSHTVRIVVYSNNGSIRGVLEFSTPFSL